MSRDHLARDVTLAKALTDGTVARTARRVPRVDRYAHRVTFLGSDMQVCVHSTAQDSSTESRVWARKTPRI